MNTLVKVLTEKLKMLGYNDKVIASVIAKIDISLIENKLVEVDDYSKYIDVYEYNEPCTEIIRAFLNINNRLLETEVIEGDIETMSSENAYRMRFVAANYSLDKRCAVIAISNDFRIKIFIYAPNQKVQIMYSGKKYEEVYKEERNAVTQDYKEAFERNKRMSERRVEEILSMLVADYIIDEMIIYSLNPRLKMYDDPEKYAQNITTYSIRFINNKTNRIEIFEKEPEIRHLGGGVVAGICNNDPYIRLEEMPTQTDFLLNTISYYWIKDNGKKQEEIAIYTAGKSFEYNTYVELRKNTMAVNMMVDDVSKSLKRAQRLDEDYSGFINGIIKSLNMELVDPPLGVVKECLEDEAESITPISYRYRFTVNPTEYEEKLYVSIEDNIGRDYKYKISEAIVEDLTRIGTKLEYTDENGELVKRQSVADFNVNAPTAIIRKETFIDEKRIPDLLGYLYDDLDDYGTEKLPIPSIYVDIYIPKEPSTKVCMYNGTSLDFTLEAIKDQNFFYNNSSDSNSYIAVGEAALPGSTYVTVRYLNSKGEILKENRIGNLFPNSTFTPEILPIINDAKGREWRAELTRIEPLIVNENPDLNIINLKYIERFTRVTFSFINREGKKIADDKQEIIQVGEIYDFETKKSFMSRENEEWKLKFSRPAKFVAKDNEEKNKVILVYDIERTDILVKYLNKTTNEELLESQKIIVPSNKKYSVDVPKFIMDSTGLGWQYIEGTETNILAKPDIVNEVILYYTENKAQVVVSFKNEQNIKLVDDRVELVQVGKKYAYSFDEDLTDFECKEWRLKSEAQNIEITVDKDKNRNQIVGVYEPVLANVTIQFLNTDNRPIKSDEIEKAQVGSIFNSESLEQIIDNFGRAWKCFDKGDKIVVKAKEAENRVILRYEPFMVKITIRYFDAEMNELLEPKYEKLQVGTTYKDKPIVKFTSKDGKQWKIDYDKIETITVKKHEEENVYSIYYEKETADVELTFFDAYGNELQDKKIIQWQIGAMLDVKMYEKISDRDGRRWMIESSEPKNLIVKERNNLVKLIYGEVKSRVLVKHINIRTQETIVDNITTTVKLGGIYIPNIRQTVLDKNKYQWKYVGDENISIVTKENEQENIIILNYEEDRAKVILKYQDTDGKELRNDAIKDVQIGKEIKIEPTKKFTDMAGLMWKYKSIKIENKIVQAADNIIIATYEPVMANVTIKYVDAEKNSITSNKVISVQVGKKFETKLLDRVNDNGNRVWVYSDVTEKETVVKEEGNEILMTFTKLMQNIPIWLVDEEGNLIAEPIMHSMQVGDIFKIPYEKAYNDKEEKAWILRKVDKEEMITKEKEEENIVKVWYAKEMVEVQLKYLNDAKEIIKNNSTERAQIGSIYKPQPYKEIIDGKTGLGWKLPENFKLEYKVKRNPAENILDINYEKLKVNVKVNYKDAKDVEVKESTIYSEQVGTTFTPKVEQEIYDPKQREWLYGLVEENKLFAGARNKVESIVVNRNEEKNFINLSYRPSMIKVIIRYQDPLGGIIREDKEVMAQIGSIYEAEAINVIEDKRKVKWVYNPNSKTSIKVTKDEKKNIIVLAYEEEKALVTYKYRDEDGNRLRSPKRKLVQIGSTYTPEVESVIEDIQGRVWEYKAKNVDKLEIKEDESENLVEIVYMPLKVDTILRFVNVHGKQIKKDQIVKAQLGSEYTPNIDEKMTDENSKLYRFVKCNPEMLKIVEMPIGALESPNLFELTYEPVFTNVTISYKTIDGEKIKDDEVTQVQVGTLYDVNAGQYIKDAEGIEWELVTKDIDTIRAKEDERENTVSLVYEVAKAEVTIRYKDMDGNTIFKSDIMQIEVGREYIPKPKEEIVDDNNKKWVFSMVNPVKLTVGSINNIITVTYQEKKSYVTILYQNESGKKLKEDYKVKAQIGQRFEARNIAKVIYNENVIWRFNYSKPSAIVVSENPAENVMIQVYTEEERESEKKQEQTGTYYNPEVEKFIDKNLVAEAEKEEEEEKKQEELRREELAKQKDVPFDADKLRVLERSFSLKPNEKATINKLNAYNDEINSKVNNVLSQIGGAIDYNAFEKEINNIFEEERNTIKDGLNVLIQDDKSGKILLKVFEAITSSDNLEKDLYILQQRKVIMLADYFINKQTSEMEQAVYICDRGIIEKEIEVVEGRMAELGEKKNRKEEELYRKCCEAKLKLIYEKAILNIYSKSRSKIKDEYFTNSESKNEVPAEVVIAVANTLSKRAYKLISKIFDLTFEQENELDAILKLMNTQQLGTLATMVEKIQNGRTRKQALRKIQGK